MGSGWRTGANTLKKKPRSWRGRGRTVSLPGWSRGRAGKRPQGPRARGQYQELSQAGPNAAAVSGELANGFQKGHV